MSDERASDAPRPEFGPHEAAPFSSPYAPPYPGTYGTPPPPGPAWATPPTPYPAPPVPPRPARLRRRLAVGLGAGAVAAAAVIALAVAGGTSQTVNGAAQSGPTTHHGSNGTGNGGSGGQPGRDPFGNYPFGKPPSAGGNGSTGTATVAQQVGVVDINTVLKYQGSAAAGTGIVLDSSGDVLTNNHVINGATSIRATVVSTGRTYTAKVVGTAPTKDIAVIHLQNASGLQTANLGDSSAVQVGDPVTGVGNAGGAGGTPSAAKGKIIAVNKTITASDQDGSGAETLHGVFVTDAPIQPGDSGGPLYNGNDEVIGIDTAASTNGTTQGFAIPIKSAVSVAERIESGVETSAIHIGYPAFLGIEVARTNTTGVPGAEIAGIINGLPAQRAGLEAGDVITKVNGASVTSPASLKKIIEQYGPGDRVTVYYDDQTQRRQHVSLVLATGPAD